MFLENPQIEAITTSCVLVRITIVCVYVPTCVEVIYNYDTHIFLARDQYELVASLCATSRW